MTTPAGVCRFCGCSEYDACRVDNGFSLDAGCSWIDRTRSVCSACAPAAKAEAIALRTVAKRQNHRRRDDGMGTDRRGREGRR